MGDADHQVEPPGTPLQPVSPDRVNQQSNNTMTTPGLLASIMQSPNRDSDVHEKIRQFNSLSHLSPGSTSPTKQFDRAASDAALKRAVIGREEAEAEMRRYREEARNLRKQVEEGKERERRVGERLETVMESYGRAKETYSHTQTIWEKEIRRARKETFKSQSAMLKVQEELKTARVALKSVEECLEREKELSKAREQEAFAGRYQLATLKESLEKAEERIKFLEEERDAFKEAAKSEEIARIAAEGRLPLPPEDPESEFASPKKTVGAGGRESLSAFEILSSASTEAEVEELTRLWQWEKQRADRTQDHLEFVQAEFELFSSRRKSTMRRSMAGGSSSRQERLSTAVEMVDPSDLMILGKDLEGRTSLPPTKTKKSKTKKVEAQAQAQALLASRHDEKEEAPTFQMSRASETPMADSREGSKEPSSRRESRRGTVFVPSEGIFRTLTEQELEAMEEQQDNSVSNTQDASLSVTRHHQHQQQQQQQQQPEPRQYARTPSAEPPSFALMVAERTSLMSLLNAPRESDASIGFDIPTRTGDDSRYATENEDNNDDDDDEEAENLKAEADQAAKTPSPTHSSSSAAAFYTVTTTTTIPMKGENASRGQRSTSSASSSLQRGGEHNVSRTPSFDVNNPALIPTMTREEALAQIRERRGRARSAMQGAMTPRKQMVTGTGDRNVSAPAGTAAAAAGSSSTTKGSAGGGGSSARSSKSS